MSPLSGNSSFIVLLTVEKYEIAWPRVMILVKKHNCKIIFLSCYCFKRWRRDSATCSFIPATGTLEYLGRNFILFSVVVVACPPALPTKNNIYNGRSLFSANTHPPAMASTGSSMQHRRACKRHSHSSWFNSMLTLLLHFCPAPCSSSMTLGGSSAPRVDVALEC